MSYDQTILRRIVEGALLAAGEALTVDRLLGLFEENERPEKKELVEALTSLQTETVGRGFQLVEVASGWRYQVAHDLAYWVNRLWEEKPQKYSRALLETLSLIAYRQPITRSDIEEVRGVAVSSHIIRTLAEREWIKVVGHRDVPGRPSLYATTKQFLDYLGLKSLDELPTLSELKDIDGLNESLELDETAEEQDQIAEARGDDSEANPESQADDSGVNVDTDPQIEEVAPPPLTPEEEVADHNSDEIDDQTGVATLADDAGADAEDLQELEGPTKPVPGSLFEASDASEESRTDDSSTAVDTDPQIEEVAPPPLTPEEEVADHNSDEIDDQTGVATLADDAGADAEDLQELDGPAKPDPGSLFDSSDASGLTADPDDIQSSGNEPDDQNKSSDI